MITIVGGGPAALGAAIACGRHALILERNPEPGRKLLLSGSGQCNFSNARASEEFLQALGSFRNWLKPAFYGFNNTSFMQLLADNGCAVYVREDGKVFPQSMRAADVVNTLAQLAIRQGAKIGTNCKVTGIGSDKGAFRITCEDGEIYKAKRVLIAAGGAAWPQTGSNGASYRLAAKLGHRILPPRPALASVQIKGYGVFRNCAGISLKAGLKMGKHFVYGDLLFTHKGFSGPLILDNSWQLEAGQSLYLKLADASALLRMIGEHPKRRVLSLLSRIGLPQSLAEAILSHLGVVNQTIAAELRKVDRIHLLQWLEAAEFSIQQLEPLATAMSDYGGVDLTEVNSKTMESRIIPGLYFAGESLAYSLPSGGFSIQMAFSTGYLAGKSMMNSV